jgi:RecA/RadA recombinase
MAKKEKTELRPLSSDELSKRWEVERNAINQQHAGKARVVASDEMSFLSAVIKWPTGVLSLDAGLGGGFPSACINEAVGHPGLGKTTIYMTAMGRAQARMGNNTMIAIAAPETYDKMYGKMLGFHVSMSNTEIELWEEALARKFTEKELVALRHQVGHIEFIRSRDLTLLDAILDVTKTNLFQIIFLDSVGSLTSIHGEGSHDTESVGDRRHGGVSPEITNFANGFMGLMGWQDRDGNPYQTSLFVVNQVRENLKSQMGGKSTPGGWGLRHAKSISVDFFPTEQSQIKDKTGAQIGKKVAWMIRKGKHGTRDGIGGDLNMMFAPTRLSDYTTLYTPERGPVKMGGFDFYSDLVTVANEHGIFTISGSHYYLPNWEEDEDVPQHMPPEECAKRCILHVNGRDALAYALFSDPNLSNDVLERVRAATGWADYERSMWIPVFGMPVPEAPKKTPKRKAAKAKAAKENAGGNPQG